MKALLGFILLLPVVLCFGLAFKYAGDERAFEQGGERARGTIKAIHEETRWDGRDSEDITSVEVEYTTKDAEPLMARAIVGSALGLSPGETVDVVYKKTDPKEIQIRAGFFQRSGRVVFFTVFGTFWLVLGLSLFVFALRMRAIAKDPTSRERILQRKEELQREQAEREKHSQ
jgi:hypothetical protein